jgi:hypothetical protein
VVVVAGEAVEVDGVAEVVDERDDTPERAW